MYTVYWIHYPHQTNIISEGYIGITNNLERRIKEHNSVNKLFRHRIQKGAIVTVLYKNLNYNLACCYEYNLRPYENLGWNLSKGGNIPPSRKSKTGWSRKGDDRTNKQKEGDKRRSQSMKGKLAYNKISITMFGKEYDSITSALKDLKITYSQYIIYKENVEMFSNENDIKEYCRRNRIKKISETREKSNKIYRGIYHIIDPEGNEHVISNGIERWCKNRGLIASNLRRDGYSKGYKCTYEHLR